jgi:hypothetical protein
MIDYSDHVRRIAMRCRNSSHYFACPLQLMDHVTAVPTPPESLDHFHVPFGVRHIALGAEKGVEQKSTNPPFWSTFVQDVIGLETVACGGG